MVRGRDRSEATQTLFYFQILFKFIFNSISIQFKFVFPWSIRPPAPSNSASGRVGSNTSPWVSHNIHNTPGWEQVCSGWIFLGLGGLRSLGTFTGLGGLSPCILQYSWPGWELLRQGVPLPVTPLQGCLEGGDPNWSALTSSRNARSSCKISSIVLEKGREFWIKRPEREFWKKRPGGPT